MKRNTFLFLAVLKSPLQLPIYFNIIMPIIGLWQFLQMRTIPKIYLVLFAMLFINLIPTLYFNNSASYIRLTQLFFILFFSIYMIKHLDLNDYSRIFKTIIFLSPIFFLLEFITIGDAGTRDFFGISLTRLTGITGEFNFTAGLLSGICLFFMIGKRYPLAIFAALQIFATAGRGAFLPLVIFTGLVIVKRLFNRGLALTISFFLLMLMFLYPLFLLKIHHLLDFDTAVKINFYSSLRYQLHLGYAQIGLEYPLGVGYFNGVKTLPEYTDLFGWRPQENILEQHNLFLQVFSEFGWIGYGLFIIFLLSIVRYAYFISDRILFGFVSFLSMFLFLNGLHEFIFWAYISFIVYLYNEGRKNENHLDNT